MKDQTNESDEKAYCAFSIKKHVSTALQNMILLSMLTVKSPRLEIIAIFKSIFTFPHNFDIFFATPNNAGDR